MVTSWVFAFGIESAKKKILNKEIKRKTYWAVSDHEIKVV